MLSQKGAVNLPPRGDRLRSAVLIAIISACLPFYEPSVGSDYKEKEDSQELHNLLPHSFASSSILSILLLLLLFLIYHSLLYYKVSENILEY